MAFKEWTPAVTMAVVTVAFAVMNTMIKKVVDEGLDPLVLVALRQLVATVLMAPFAYFWERESRPKMTAVIFLLLFISALLGASATQYLFVVGLRYTSATSACAFLNMAPAITFLLTLLMRSETLNLKNASGIAKALGTLVCLAGAVLMMFYQGKVLNNSPTSHVYFSSSSSSSHHKEVAIGKGKWMLGSALLFAGTLLWSSWFILQSRIMKKYPALYSCTAFIFFLSFLQAAIWSLSTQKSFSPWVLRKKFDIIVVIFTGLVGSGIGFLAMSWCVEQRGPVFTSAFTPLIEVVAALIDFTILHEPLHLGSVLGSVLVIGGLYFLLWGRSRDVLIDSCTAMASEMQEKDSSDKQGDAQIV